jgi:hypothetical protein
MKPGLKWIGLLLAIMLCGCNPASMIQRMASKDDDNVAQYYIGLLRSGNLGPIERDMDPSLKAPGMHDGLLQAANMIPRQDPTSVKMVGTYTNRGSNLYQSNLTYEYQYSDKWLLINVATQKSGDAFTIIRLRVQPLADSLEHLNRFTLTGKNPLQYAILIWGAITAVFILYCLIRCIRANGLKRKWLWILFILFGFGELAVNWTTGEMRFSLLAFQLLGFSAFAALYGPWIVKVGFPLGALIYLLRGRRIEPSSLPLRTDNDSNPPESWPKKPN